MNKTHRRDGAQSETEGARTLLFLHPTTGDGDADVTLLDLVRGLDRTRWRPIVALPHEGPLAALLRLAGVVVELGPLAVVERRTLRSKLGLLRFAVQLPLALVFVRKLVKRHRPALIHTSSASVIGGALGARLTGARHLWQLHETGGLSERAERAFARLAAWLADVVVSSSHAARRVLDRHSARLAARHSVVHCGIDRRRLAHGIGRDAARRDLEVGEHTSLIVLVGPVVEWQGHELLLDAAERLRFRHPDAELLVVGDPPHGEERRVVALREEIERRELTGYVRHLPQPSDRASALVAADIVVVPSTQPQSFALVAVEAMACARPVVAAAHGGIVEIVEPGVTGLVFEPGDAEGLAGSLQVLVEERGRAREMGRKGAARQAEHFSIERAARQMDRLWSQVAARTFAHRASETRLVHVVLGDVDPGRLGEVEDSVHHLAAAQAARGFDVTVLGISNGPGDNAAMRQYPFQHFRAAERRFELVPELVAFLDALSTTAVVHLHGGFVPTMSALGAALARRRIPFVLTPYGAYRELARRRGGIRLRVYTWLHERWLLRRARSVQAFSGRERLEMAGLVNLAKVVVAPCGQDVLSAAHVVDTGGIRRPLYGYCGRLSRGVDGVDALVQAFALHAANDGEGTLWLFGDGDDRPRLEASVHDLGLTRRVAFDGECFGAERIARLQALDVLVHPSGREGLPKRALEAAALGKAIVVTSDTSLGREVRQHGAGFVLEHPDPEQLAAALSACEREWHAGTLAERGASARAMVEARFAWSLVEPQLCRELYRLDDAELAPLSSPAPDAAGFLAEHGERRRSA